MLAFTEWPADGGHFQDYVGCDRWSELLGSFVGFETCKDAAALPLTHLPLLSFKVVSTSRPPLPGPSTSSLFGSRLLSTVGPSEPSPARISGMQWQSQHAPLEVKYIWVASQRCSQRITWAVWILGNESWPRSKLNSCGWRFFVDVGLLLSLGSTLEARSSSLAWSQTCPMIRYIWNETCSCLVAATLEVRIVGF